MAETAVLFALGEVFQFLKEETNLLSGVHKDFSDIKDELESIQVFLKDADRRAADEADTNDGIRTWVKQLREASFCIEDVIDEYSRLMHGVKPPGCGAYVCKIVSPIKTLIPRHQIASEIQDIKLSIRGIKERSERYNFQISHEHGSSSSNSTGETENGRWRDPRLSSLFIEETEIVGIEGPKEELSVWLLDGASERTVISVVGMGGLGKTTLAKLVFDSQKVSAHFDCRACVTVSQSYTVRGLLINMMEQFCRGIEDLLSQMLHKMDDKSLIIEVRQYLQHKRYLIFFDDVWQEDFSDQVEFAMPNTNKGSRIMITTRMMQVADFFKKSFPVHVHNLQLLPPEKAWELFCKKVFRFELDGHCPQELEPMSKDIVRKCKQLPLAIVTIGGLLSTKSKTMIEWKNVSENLILELGRNAHLTSLTKILSLSYDDLPYYLKPCILYFGLYPEDYSINHKRLTRQWIAEGFVKFDERRTSEKVAEEYLSELIHRSLIQVSNVFEGHRKIKSCQVHDLLREVIIRKMKGLSFCHLVHEDGESVAFGITRRLSIATNSNHALKNTNNSHFHAIHVFEKGGLLEPFIGKLCSQSRVLKVLDIQGMSLNHIPSNLGNLFHLRYLNLRNTKIHALPKSVGELQNLETLDLRDTLVHNLPSEINKLTKLQHLLAFHRNYEAEYSLLGFTTGVSMEKGIKNLICLQNLYYVEVDHGGVNLIQEMKMLSQLRRLGLRHVRREHGKALSAALVEMKHLENLNITTIAEDETINLNFSSSPPQLQRLHLKAKLDILPEWIPNLDYLVEIKLALSKLKDDPLQSLKNLPNLQKFGLWDNAYDGEILHFQNGGFLKLRKLDISRLDRVNSVLIDKGSLLSLEYFTMDKIPQLNEVPSGIRDLDNLKVIYFSDLPAEFSESIDPDKGQYHCFIKHVPLVIIRHWIGPNLLDYEIQTITSSSK